MAGMNNALKGDWERQYAAALGCEFCDPTLMSQELLELRKRMRHSRRPRDDDDDDEPEAPASRPEDI